MTSRSKRFLLPFILALLRSDWPAGCGIGCSGPTRVGRFAGALAHAQRAHCRPERPPLYEALDQQGGRHAVVGLETIPLDCRQATIATEDRSFYHNPGVDLRGMVRAVWINLHGGETIAGGSTITQQVVRNLLLESGERGERSLRRKLREAILAWQLTQRKSKDDILALYLNQTYYGGMAYGIEAAAQTFFGKPASRLDLAECALLAGLPQAPAVYNPFTDLASARKRQEVVLNLMAADGYISAEQAQLASEKSWYLPKAPIRSKRRILSCWCATRSTSSIHPKIFTSMGGLVVHTTLDLDWQRQAEETIKHQLAALAAQPGRPGA